VTQPPGTTNDNTAVKNAEKRNVSPEMPHPHSQDEGNTYINIYIYIYVLSAYMGVLRRLRLISAAEPPERLYRVSQKNAPLLKMICE
jgi:hypothetical protein